MKHIPLADEVRQFLPTDIAAYHLGRAPSTLRMWACLDKGPLKPRQIAGRLAWPVADLRRLLSEVPA